MSRNFTSLWGKLFPSIAIAAAVSFSGCASNGVSVNSNTPVVYVTNTKPVHILEPVNISRPMDEIQLFEGTFGERNFSLPAYIAADENSIEISILNDVGTSLGNLLFDGVNVTLESSIFPANLKAEYIVWDIQLAYYNPQSISERLAASRLSFEISSSDGIETRRILNDGKLIEEILVSKNTVSVKNHLRGYEFNLTGVGDE